MTPKKQYRRTYRFTAYFRRDGESEKRKTTGSVKAINETKAKLEIVKLIREANPAAIIEISGFTLEV